LLRYIPRTITLGFTAGIAMGIFSGQLKGFFGLSMGAIPVKVLDKFAAYAKVIDTVHIPTLLVGLLALLVLIVFPKIKYINKIPNSLAAILITTPVVLWMNGQGMGVATIKSVYGEIPSHFPTPKLPQISWQLIENILPSAFTMAILIAIVSLLACVVTDGLMGEKHDSNQELIAQGIANIFCGLFGAAPVAGAVARASNSVKSGGRTPIAGIVHSIVVTIILLCMMPLAGFIPMPTLAAILILVAYNMSNWREFVLIWKTAPKSDFIVLITTFIAGVVVDLLFAVEVGVLLSAVLFLRKISNTTTIRQWTDVCDGPDPENPQMNQMKRIPEKTLVYEIDGPMFFATVDELISHMSIHRRTDVIIIRMRGVQAVDFTAIRALENLLTLCQKKNIQLIFSHTLEKPMEVMQRAGYVEKVGAENFCENIDTALERAKQFIKVS
jgi:SulP family sulfate permease